MNLRALLCLMAILAVCATRGAETGEQLTIEGEGGGFSFETGVATYTNAIVKYGLAVLTADRIEISERTGQTFAEGHVVLLREGGSLWRGERLTYNFKTRVISGTEFRTGQPPFFAQGEGLITSPTNNSYHATNAFFTTDDYPKPAYRIRAKRLVIVPGKSIEAHDATLYLGDVPVFYFPYLHRSLDRHPNNFEFTPGYRTRWGPYLLNTYNWYWEQRLHGSLNFDVRGRRGLAGGPDFFWQDPTLGQGLLRYYYARDNDPTKETGFDALPDNRQRLLFAHQATIRPYLTAKAVAAYQSDPFIVRDFFESEYNENVQPKSFLEVNQAWPNWSLDAMAQAQINDFQETVERLPDVKLTGLRQEIGSTPLYYESESSAGYFRRRFADIHTQYLDPGTGGYRPNPFYPYRTNTFGASRVDTYHQILWPNTFFGWLNFTPRVGQRFTYYSEVDTADVMTREEFRNVFNTGAEISFKASRLWRAAENNLLEVRGLRHIVEPTVNYVYVPRPDALPRELPQFDTELPTSRLLPVEFPDYNAIDAIDTQNVLRLGLRNKLQTKREDRIENLVHWALYTDWRLNPRRGQTTFADIYSDLDFKPRRWLMLNSETRFNERSGQFREANHLITVQPGEDWSVSLGHRYRDTTPELGLGNNLFLSTFFFRLNENWGMRITHQFEARDGKMEQQYYTIYRDFRSWTGALTFRVRDDRAGPDDYTVALMFSVKAFPRFGVGADAVKPQRLLGG